MSGDKHRTIQRADLSDAGLTAMDLASIDKTLNCDPSTAIVEASSTGELLLPSPSDGRLVRCAESVTPDCEQRFLYRLPADLWLLALGNHCMNCGIYVPAADTVIARSPYHADFIRSHFRDGIGAEVGDLLAASRPAHSGFVMPVRGRFGHHLGVYIWGILTGLELLATAKPGKAFELAVEWGSDSDEKFGGIDDLFPELSERIVRGLDGMAGVRRHAATTDRMLVQVSTENVSPRIGERVLAVSGPPYQRDWPVVVLGFRVENRTVSDLAGLYVRLIGHMVGRCGRITVVLDGHNSALDGRVYASDYQGAATRQPIDVEREIAASIKNAIGECPAEVIDIIGAPLAESVRWNAAADFFVAPWGAGLAKHRWIANKPGITFTSQWNLTKRGDLHIYGGPQFKGTPMTLLDASAVEDLPDEPLLLPFSAFPAESIWNFRIDEHALFAAVDKLLSSCTNAAHTDHPG